MIRTSGQDPLPCGLRQIVVVNPLGSVISHVHIATRSHSVRKYLRTSKLAKVNAVVGLSQRLASLIASLPTFRKILSSSMFVEG